MRPRADKDAEPDAQIGPLGLRMGYPVPSRIDSSGRAQQQPIPHFSARTHVVTFSVETSRWRIGRDDRLGDGRVKPGWCTGSALNGELSAPSDRSADGAISMIVGFVIRLIQRR